jgi:hypothetical protein
VVSYRFILFHDEMEIEPDTAPHEYRASPLRKLVNVVIGVYIDDCWVPTPPYE